MVKAICTLFLTLFFEHPVFFNFFTSSHAQIRFHLSTCVYGSKGVACGCPVGGGFGIGDWKQGLASRTGLTLVLLVCRNKDVPAEPVRAGTPV